MKKLTVLVIVTLVFAGMSQAQLKYGVKVGANVSGFFTESTVADEQTPRINFQLGGIMQYNFWIFTLQPELLFSQKGFRIDDAYDKEYLKQYAGLTSQDPELRYTSYHIDLPINLLYKVNVGKTKVFVEAGPHVSFNLGGSFNGSKADYRSYAKAFPYRWIDYGAGAGAGVEYKKFQFAAKYDWNFNWMGSNVENIHGTGNTNVFHDMKYMNLSLTMGYFF